MRPLFDEKSWEYLAKLFQLSPRELDVARLICQGFNNKQIAKILKIKPGTVKIHVTHIFVKACVPNKINLLLKFLDRAL